MKLTFKDLKQQKFVIEAESSELISDVKEKISKEKGWEPAQQKLIYSGKILQDANTVESYKIEEKGFIVCMVSKPKPVPQSTASPSASTPSKVPSTPAPAVAQTPAIPAAPQQSSSTTTTNVPSTPSPAGATQPAGNTAGSSAPGGLAMGAERAAQIAEMEAMGFERAQIDLAMRAAFFNGERAIEYLLNGIPANLQQEQRAAPAQPQGSNQPAAQPQQQEAAGANEGVNLFEAAAQAGQGNRGSGGGARGLAGLGAGLGAAGAGAAAGDAAAGGSMGNLDFLRNNPQFQQLRQVVQQQPQMLETILQQVAAGNPQLAQLIAQNPEQFMQLLSEQNDDDAPLPPGAQTISVTEEEQAAIERLVALGFHRDQAIQAYFACDKNEELAANFLFEQPDDDMD